MFLDNGKKYKVNWVANTLEITANVINGDNSGRLQGNKDMFLDYVGTFFEPRGTFVREKGCSEKEWWDFFQELSNPLNTHMITFPFGLETMTCECYVSQCKIRNKDTINGNHWNETIEVEFKPLKSQWLAGGRLNLNG